MKRQYLTTILLILCSIIYGQEYSQKDFYGAWSDTTSNTGGDGFIFLPDSSWILIWDGNMTGGKLWIDDKDSLTNYFITDFNESPNKIELITKNLTSGKLIRINGWFNFISKTQLQMNISTEHESLNQINNPNEFEMILIKYEK